MSDNKLKKVVKKYNEKFELNKQDFIQFVTTRVQLTKAECTTYLRLIDQLVDSNKSFDELFLYHLLHVLAAFQEGHDVKSISDQQIVNFTKIKFKQKVIKPNTKELQKTQIEYVQHNRNTNNANPSKNLSIKNNYAEIAKKQIPEEKSKNSLKNKNQDFELGIQTQKAKYPPAYQRVQKDYAYEVEDEDESLTRFNQKRKQDQYQRRRQSQIQKISKQKQIEEEQKQKEQQRSKTKSPQSLVITKKQSQQSDKSIYNQQGKSIQIKKRQSINDGRQLNRNQVQYSVQNKGESCPKHLNTIEQQRSEEINFNSDSLKIKDKQVSGKLQVIEAQLGKQLVNITKFQKTGQDFMNPVIKYQIVYKDQYVTWRRYSQIQKLLAYLRVKYEGIVLPEMPPKEGIKGNLTYFWKSGVNQQFLDERKERLKHLLNRVLACQYVAQDQVLDKFLSDQQYELPNMGNSSDSYFQALFGLKDIVFNYNQLKDYGMAYYNYISEYKKKPINSRCSQEFDKLQCVMASILAINEHRIALNLNFEKRRQIMYDSNLKPKGPVKTDLDKILQQAEIECHQLNMEYSRYLQLKSTEGWENQLIKQKSAQGGDALEKIKESHTATTGRIIKTETNLLTSMKKFSQKNEKILQTISKQIMDWRRKAHP